MSSERQGAGGARRSDGSMGLWQSTAIGVGGMIGAGIFSVMGIAGRLAGPAAALAFALAGVLALGCAWSFGRLGARYPSAGGPVEYLCQGLGSGLVSGALNILLWGGYVLALAMYASAFGHYGASLMPGNWQAVATPVLTIGVSVAFVALNVAGAEAVGRAELAVVAVKVLILLGFVAILAPGVSFARIAPAQWPGFGNIASAAAVIFLSYEGFGLITNAAEDMRNPEKTLPRSILLSVAFTALIYVLVSFTVLGILSIDELVAASEYALARAAEPTLGQAGFVMMAVAALFSTASAINATLYGGANVSARLAEKGALPSVFRERIWMGSPGSIFITGGATALLGSTLEIERIAMAGSAAFLVVYGGVNVAHLRLTRETGAPRWAVALITLGCFAVFTVLVGYLYREDRMALVGLGAMIAGSFLVERAWQAMTRRKREVETRED